MKTGLEADKINKSETCGDLAKPARGALPVIKRDPIRKRAYYRALKRKETWALFRQSTESIWKMMASDFYNISLNPSKFNIMGLNESLSSSDSYIRIEYGNPDGP